MVSQDANNWLKQGERGLSSETIFSTMTGVNVTARSCHPSDPADFRRCEMLLRSVPDFREKMEQMRILSPVWQGLVEHWQEIVDLMESEVPGVFNDRWTKGSAPKTYDLMKSIGC